MCLHGDPNFSHIDSGNEPSQGAIYFSFSSCALTPASLANFDSLRAVVLLIARQGLNPSPPLPCILNTWACLITAVASSSTWDWFILDQGIVGAEKPEAPTLLTCMPDHMLEARAAHGSWRSFYQLCNLMR